MDSESDRIKHYKEFETILKYVLSTLMLFGLFMVMSDMNFFPSFVLSVGFVYGAVLMMGKGMPVTERVKPQILDSQPMYQQVKNQLANTRGIFIGRTQRVDETDLRVSTSDRGLVIGPPGTGKTTFLISQIIEWAKQGKSFVVFDYKPEIYDILSDRQELSSYRLVRVNPIDPAADQYNPLREVDDEMAVAELTAALIPGKSPEHEVFTIHARMLLEAIILHLKVKHENISMADVMRFKASTGGIEDLIVALSASRSQRAASLASSINDASNNERFFGSVMASFNEAMNLFTYSTIVDSLAGNDVSLDMIKRYPVAWVVQIPEAKKETLAPLAALYVTHLFTWLIENTDREEVALFVDEIGNVTRIPSLTQKLNTVRSRKIPVWTYWQNTEQMQLYGTQKDEGVNIIMGACDLHILAEREH